ncbi:uncharacterized protein LOC122282238 [Carya illinoinensis]|uniref:uncharacterized protein LOC122282238 n=1 Tax=Carya illinoinensis TaxID=32201 RepID=UPI001C726942|nr:uncharacterized protein LOC122282238 [Carya illinoinensis]
MCNGKFFSKEPDEALSFFDYLAKSAQQWNTRTDRVPLIAQPLRAISGRGKYELKKDTNVQAQIAALTRRLETQATTNNYNIQAINELRVSTIHQTPIILGRPFFAALNALINCRSGVLKLTFGNMILEMNVFNACKMPSGCDDSDVHVVDMVYDFDVLELLSVFDSNSAYEDGFAKQSEALVETIPTSLELT